MSADASTPQILSSASYHQWYQAKAKQLEPAKKQILLREVQEASNEPGSLDTCECLKYFSSRCGVPNQKGETGSLPLHGTT